MRDGHALRATRRARSVDHVGEASRRDMHTRVVLSLACNLRPVCVQRHLPPCVLRQALAQARLRQQHRSCRVIEHERQARSRIIGVQRHVCASRLQDPQQPHYHLQRALDANAHQRLGPDSKRAQMMRQLIRPAVELAVGQLSVFKAHCQGLRPPSRLLLEQLMDALLARKSDLGVIPLNQQLMPIGFSQQRQVPDARLRVGNHCLQQPNIVRHHALGHVGHGQVRDLTPAGGLPAQEAAHALQDPADVAVADHHALGRSGGTGRRRD